MAEVKNEKAKLPAKEKLHKFSERFFEIEDDNHLSGYEVFYIFMICNVIGYCVEMVWCFLKNGYWYIFIKSWFWGSVSEYISSLGEEIVFGHVSWDYSHMPLNINGRVCFLYSLFWGVLGLVWCKLIYPSFIKFIHKIPIKPGKIIFWILFLFMLVDIVLSAEAVNRYNQRHDGVPASNKVDVFLDEHFTDEFLQKVYANAMEVDK